MKKTLCFFSFLLLVLTVIGCGGNSRLSGKVTFTDGKPATHGMVIFTNVTDSFQAKGEINKDGTYVVGSTKARNGLPPGEYKVFVSGIDTTAQSLGMGIPVPLCAEKYQNASTSGLTCTVPAPKNTYNIELEPHPVNYH